jgi:tetratricopeptide (TPR) repeat protein
MEAYAKPIREMSDALSYFIRVPELRLLDVEPSEELRGTAVHVAFRGEFHADNKSPFVVLEDAFIAADEGWSARAARLRAQHAARREQMLKAGESMPELSPAPVADDAFTAFARQLAQVLATRADVHEGLMVVFAPVQAESTGLLCERLRALMDTKQLADVRWILVDPMPPALSAVTDGLEARAMRVEVRANKADADRELKRILNGMANAAPDAPAYARMGAAWPRGAVLPPRRDRSAMHKKIEELIPSEDSALPAPATYSDELSREVLKGAQAMRRGDATAAVAHQAQARDICIGAGLHRERAQTELMLAGYLEAAGELVAAAGTYRGVSTFAQEKRLVDLAMQAELRLAVLCQREGLREEAVNAYMRAATLAEGAGLSLCTTEARRLAGLLKGG